MDFEFKYFLKKLKYSRNLSRQCFDLNKDGMIDCIIDYAFSNVETINTLYSFKTEEIPKKDKIKLCEKYIV